MLYTNADQFVNKRDDLCMSIVDDTPDIICITEVIPKAQVVPITPALIAIEGFTCYTNFDLSQERLGASGQRGIGVFVSNKLSVREYKTQTAFFEQLWLQVKLEGGDSLMLGCIYRSPSTGLEETKLLCSLLEEVSDTRPTHLLITGDFNFGGIDWETCFSSDPPSHPSHLFLEAIMDTFMHQHVTFPTRYRLGTTPHILDLLLTNEEEMVQELQCLPGIGNSDHVVLVFNLTCYASKTESTTEKLALNKGNYERLRELAGEVQWAEFRTSNMEDDYQFVTQKLDQITKQCIPKYTPGKKRRHIYMNAEAMALKKRKQRLWKRYARSEDPADHLHYTRARNDLRSLTRQLRKEFEEGLAAGIKENPKAFWQYANSRLHTKAGVCDLKLHDGSAGYATTDQDKAEVLSRFFSSVFTLENIDEIPTLPIKWQGPFLEDIEITPAQVEQKLLHLRPSSSPGHDGIHPRVLQELAIPLSRPLSAIFRKSLDEAKIPDEWKEAEVVPIFKKGAKDEASNYRPVSLTSIPSKVCESLIRDEILAHMMESEQLNRNQHGFLPRRSCVSQLLETLDDWTREIEEGHPVDVAYLDFQKAFDSVPHCRLLSKLHDLGIRGKVLAWIKNFLTGRRQRIVVRGSKSSWAPVLSGIPQGSVLGPTLFLLYVNDLPDNVQSGIKLFADDAKVYANVQDQRGRDHLQEDLDALRTWSGVWQMPFNATKCKVLHLGPGNPQYAYTMFDVHLEQVGGEKDLGVIIDSSLKFRKQAAAAVAKANRVLGAIRRSFEHIDQQTLPLLYKTLVRPLLEYGNAAWGPYNAADIKLVERVQRRATRLVRPIRHYSYEDRLRALCLPSLQYRRRRGDVILIHQVMNGRVDINKQKFFQDPPSTVTRGHSLKIAKPQAQSRVRRNFWSVRAVNDWNRLPESVVSSATTNLFKNRLDEHWAEYLYDAPA